MNKNLIELITDFQEKIIAHVTAKTDLSNQDYLEARNKLIIEPKLNRLLPLIVMHSRSVGELSQEIKANFPTYKERRLYIRKEFRPALNFLEFGHTPNHSINVSNKAFISYSNKERHIAGKVKKILEQYEIESFMAHDDIHVSEEWASKIIEEANTCKFFVFLLSKNFIESHYCIQEMGIAASRSGLCVIPLSLDGQIPTGFLNKFQATPVAEATLSILNLLPAFLKHDIRKGMEIFLTVFAGLRGYRFAEDMATLIKPFLGKINANEASKLIAITRENNQIYDAGRCATQFLPLLILNFPQQIDSDTKNFFESKIAEYS